MDRLASPASSPRPRALLDRPQRLGFLPTLWFWNDLRRQQLILPLLAGASLVLAPLLLWLTIRHQLPVWLFVGAGLLAPYLITGLVERHIRRELARSPDALAPATGATLELPVQRTCAALAVACGLVVLLAALEVTRPVLLASLAVCVGGSLAYALAPRAPRTIAPLDAGHRGREE